MQTGTNDGPSINIYPVESEFHAHLVILGFCGPLVIGLGLFAGLTRNEWGLFCWTPALIAGGLALEWLYRKFSVGMPRCILYGDRFFANLSEVRFDDIELIQWPVQKSSDSLSLTVFYRNSEMDSDGDAEQQSVEVSFKSLSIDDRLLIVRCFRELECQHADWKEFCCRYVVRWTTNSKVYFSEATRDRIEKSPFWFSFSRSPWLIATLFTTVSQYMYWLLGISIAVSAWINIRLFHGQWIGPVAKPVLGLAAVLLLLGCFSAWFSSTEQPTVKTDRELRAVGRRSAVMLALSLIFGPLLFQSCGPLLVRGGGILGPACLQILMLFCVFSPMLPFLWHMRNSNRSSDSLDERYATAVETWDAYCDSH